MISAARKVQAQTHTEALDLSSYNVDDLITIREMINDEIETRKHDRENEPRITTEVRVTWGDRSNQTGIVVLHMSDSTCLVQFPGKGLARIRYEHLEVVQ